jgi:hypothetical protein
MQGSGDAAYLLCMLCCLYIQRLVIGFSRCCTVIFLLILSCESSELVLDLSVVSVVKKAGVGAAAAWMHLAVGLQ